MLKSVQWLSSSLWNAFLCGAQAGNTEPGKAGVARVIKELTMSKDAIYVKKRTNDDGALRDTVL
jgi:hypothetical protein